MKIRLKSFKLLVKVVLRVASTTVNFQIGRSLLQVKPFSKAGKSRGSLVTGKLQEHKELSTVDTLHGQVEYCAGWSKWAVWQKKKEEKQQLYSSIVRTRG